MVHCVIAIDNNDGRYSSAFRVSRQSEGMADDNVDPELNARLAPQANPSPALDGGNQDVDEDSARESRISEVADRLKIIGDQLEDDLRSNSRLRRHRWRVPGGRGSVFSRLCSALGAEVSSTLWDVANNNSPFSSSQCVAGAVRYVMAIGRDFCFSNNATATATAGGVLRSRSRSDSESAKSSPSSPPN